jgi:PAS domain-containing protein
MKSGLVRGLGFALAMMGFVWLGGAPAFSNDDNFALRLSGLSIAKFDLARASIALSFALMVVAIYAATISVLHIRARRRWSEHGEEQNRALREVLARSDRLSTCLSADRQIVITWGGPSEEPEVDGDPGLLAEAAAAHRLLSFAEWLPREAAQSLGRDVFRLRTEGIAFSYPAKTLRLDYVEIEGRPIAGRAILSIRVLSGEQLAMARLKDERQALETAFARMRGMLDAIPQPAWLRDHNGRLIWVNASYARAVDARDDTEVVDRQLELLGSSDRADIQQAIAPRGQYRGTLTIVAAGERRHVDVIEVGESDGGGGFAVDISDLVAARDALGQQMDAHVRTLDELPTAVAMFDRAQRLTYSNKAFRDLFALPVDYLATGPSNGELLDRLRGNGRLPEAPDFKGWKAELLAQFASVESVTHRWPLPNGRVLRVVISPNPQGGVTYLFEDETEHFTLVASFDRLKNAQWETLMALSEGVAVFGSDGCLQLSNPAFGQMWGMTPGALEGHPHIGEIVRAQHPEAVPTWQQLNIVVCSLEDARREQSFTLSTGEGRTLVVSATPLPDRATLVTTSDATDTVEAERRLREHNEALERAARLRTDFIRSVSFELRSPLTVVVGNAQALAGGVLGPLSERQQSYAENLAHAADAVLALTDDIFDLASVESRSIELELSAIDMRRAVQDAMEGLKDRLGEAKVRVAVNIANGFPLITADSKRMTHIIFNLLANAIAYSGAGDVVRLVVRRDGSQTLIEVTDTGKGPDLGSMNGLPGIERQHALRYSMARALVQLHAGSIMVSDDPRGGQTTLVSLPDLPSPAPAGQRRSA